MSGATARRLLTVVEKYRGARTDASWAGMHHWLDLSRLIDDAAEELEAKDARIAELERKVARVEALQGHWQSLGPLPILAAHVTAALDAALKGDSDD